MEWGNFIIKFSRGTPVIVMLNGNVQFGNRGERTDLHMLEKSSNDSPSSSVLRSFSVHLCFCLPQLINFHFSSFINLLLAFLSSLTKILSFFHFSQTYTVFHYTSFQYLLQFLFFFFSLPLYLVIPFHTAPVHVCLNSNIQLTNF